MTTALPVSPVASPVVTVVGATALDIANLLTSRDAILPESLETVTPSESPEPRSPLTTDEAVKFGLIHNEKGDKFLTALGYAWAEANEEERNKINEAFGFHVGTAIEHGQNLWQKG